MSRNRFIIDLLRHGETRAGKKFIGSSDVLLSDAGHQQMHQALQRAEKYGQIVSSPLQRCMAFAQHYAQQKNIPLTVEDRLQEYHFGDWENCSSEEIWADHPQALSNFWRDPEQYPPPAAESLADFQQRIKRLMEPLMQGTAGDELLLITHGGVIRCILADILQMPLNAMFRLQIDHASLSRIVIHLDNGKIYPSINFINKC